MLLPCDITLGVVIADKKDGNDLFAQISKPVPALLALDQGIEFQIAAPGSRISVDFAKVFRFPREKACGG